MKTKAIYLLLLLLVGFTSKAQSQFQKHSISSSYMQKGVVELPGFVKSPYFDEQVMAYTYNPNVKIEINAPSVDKFDASKPTAIVLYGLPNGNSTDWTIGKLAATGDDWHYQIQHIGAQSRFIRNQQPGYNLVTVYLETSTKSWSTWRTNTVGGDIIIKEITESILNIFVDYNPYIVLSGHSGGGNVAFGFIDAVTEIPAYVKRISFIDSNYNWDNERYGAKLKKWLDNSTENTLSVICYDDVNALLNGEPIVSATGGTWYRSQVMQKYLEDNMPSLTWTKNTTPEMLSFNADNNRIQFLMKTNPTRVIYHTVLVEKNGYIQAILSGTDKEQQNYTFFGAAAYSSLIQSSTVYPHILRIPPRKATAITGSAFMEKIKSMTLVDREATIYKEISEGNIPNSLRKVTHITEVVKDAAGIDCTLEFDVMPDFLAVGTDEDFVRIPMLPITAQKIATLFGCTLPTRKLSDLVHKNSVLKLAPITMTPDATMTTVPVFLAHNTAIEAVRVPLGNPISDLVAGHKKDIVITNRLTEMPEKLFIYGWHYQNGTAIQPLSGAHDLNYVDYSHGVRLINNEMIINGKLTPVKSILQDANKYKTISDESGVMSKIEYTVGTAPAIPSKPKEFAVVSYNATSVKVMFTPIAGATIKVFYGSSVSMLSQSVECVDDNIIIDGLNEGEIIYVALTASNENGSSMLSEVLAATPCALNADALIVNGFDRVITGNNYNFVTQHATALVENSKMIASATNDAVISNLVNLKEYAFVDYILGEESTVDKTFNSSEQTIVKEYLNNGGFLYASGAEIGWDLGRSTSGAESNAFMSDYLKCTFVSDNPGASAKLYYSAQVYNGNGFGDDGYEFSFADGTTTSVSYPDVLMPVAQAVGFLNYKNTTGIYPSTTGWAGTAYHGHFPSSAVQGKVVVMGIPFETIYPKEKRTELMRRILSFDKSNISSVISPDGELKRSTTLFQNTPNPVSGTTQIGFTLCETTRAQLSIMDTLGRIVKVVIDDMFESGDYTETVDMSNFTAGIYYYRLTAGAVSLVKKMMVK